MRLLRLVLVGVITVTVTTVTPAAAQRLPFERSFNVTGPATLDVSTMRGKIDVTTGEPGRVVVTGTVTIRVDWNVPADAVDLARKIAANPPVHQDAQTVTLRPPADPTERRAVTVSYQVQVPANTRVLATSESGATTVRGVSGAVAVRTQSGAIELERLAGSAEVNTGSGAVAVNGVAGSLAVTTGSGGVTARELRGSVRVDTRSGSVDAELTGEGDADVKTGSSAIRISGVQGGVDASSESGRVSISGVPGRAWTAYSGSGSLDIGVDSNASFSLDATTRSGSIRVEGRTVKGSITKRTVTGDLGAGGPLVRVSSRSGSVRLRLAGTNQ